MFSKLFKIGLWITLGIIAGFLLYKQFPPAEQAQPRKGTDTAFITRARATDLQTISQHRQNAITRAVKIVSPAVVSVNVTKINKFVQRSPYYVDPLFQQLFPEFFGDRVVQQPVKSIGSGFIISSDGFILTNEHVVGSNAEEIIVAMGNGKEYKAKLVGKDRVADLALLKIDQKNLPYIRFGDSDRILIGEWAIALGNPFGLFIKSQPTVTVGVISAVDRDFSPIEGRVYEDMIQTDAAINSGNSGGPLCDADGEVIGMNAFIYTINPKLSGSVGVGFAIPSNHIKKVVVRLKQRQDKDKDVWLGLSAVDLNAYLARLLHYSYPYGVLIKRIDRKSPADKAGLEPGDIILSLNGQDVQSLAQANEVLQGLDLRVGDKLYVTIWRSGKTMDKILVLVKNPH